MPPNASAVATSTEPGLSAWLAEGWAQAAEVRAVEVEGAVVRYRAWNLGARDRPVLMLVHGFLAHARWWDHIAPRLADRYCVVAPDFTGMGDSDRRATYSRRQYGRELVAVARDAGAQGDVVLVAHSFGAVSALYAAKIAPELVARVVVLDAYVFRPENETSVPVPPERSYPSVEAALERYQLAPPGRWPDPEVLAYVARHSVRRRRDGSWGWKFDPEIFRSVHRERLRDELRGMPLAVDFIQAGDSEIVGEAELAGFVANMPSCGQPVRVAHSHHHMMIERPVGLLAALDDVLARSR